MAIPNQEALNQRSRNLGAFNGIRMVLVRLNPPVNPTQAKLTLFFFNFNGLVPNADFCTPSISSPLFSLFRFFRILSFVSSSFAFRISIRLSCSALRASYAVKLPG